MELSTSSRPRRTDVYTEFRHIDAYDYFDLYASYRIRDRYLLSFGAMNVTDEDPPVVGNEAASTDFNSGNTFPSSYDTLGSGVHGAAEHDSSDPVFSGNTDGGLRPAVLF